ncbi:hypothetical protein DdX_14584 [Ditylenchus destructor]|uniref:Uncharacterized protein n=1 Tax=Ditylenchus destructor TaxID=166010 RepID=A0AAD4QYH7_9BILA|nr:hypothetical protein DdX_14584 [Ditylenchus destructor]
MRKDIDVSVQVHAFVCCILHNGDILSHQDTAAVLDGTHQRAARVESDKLKLNFYNPSTIIYLIYVTEIKILNSRKNISEN